MFPVAVNTDTLHPRQGAGTKFDSPGRTKNKNPQAINTDSFWCRAANALRCAWYSVDCIGNWVPKLIVVLLFLVLQGCGGGGTDSTLGSQPATNQPPSTSSSGNGAKTVTGYYLDSSGNPISDATLDVNVESSSGKAVVSVKTNQNGQWSATFPPGVTYPSTFVGTLRKDGYRTKEVVFALSNNGNIATMSNGTEVAVALGATDVSVLDGYKVVHLGDASFVGTANSQLQVATSGLRKSWSLPRVNARLMAGYDDLCLYMLARGVQTSDGNANTIKVTDLSLPLPDSSSDGSFSWLKTCFPTAKLSTIGTGNDLTISSGSRSGTTDYDDFEVVNLWGRLERPNGKTDQLPSLSVGGLFSTSAPITMTETSSIVLAIRAEYAFRLTGGYFPAGTKAAVLNWGDGSVVSSVSIVFDTPNLSSIFKHAWNKTGRYSVTLQYLDGSGNVLKEGIYPVQVIQ